MDPFGFEPERFNHRLAVVIQALGTGERVLQHLADAETVARADANAVSDLHSFSSAPLLEKLTRIADRFSVERSESDVLDEWAAPTNLSDLALWTLVVADPHAFQRVSAETRNRALSRIPDTVSEASPRQFEFSTRVLLAYTAVAGSLEGEERQNLERKLRSLEDTPTTVRWRWATLTALYAAGETRLRDEVDELLFEHASGGDVSNMAGLLLSGEPPSELTTRTHSLLASALERGIDPDLIIGAVARMAVHGSNEQARAAQALLGELANDERFQGRATLQELLDTLGIEKP